MYPTPYPHYYNSIPYYDRHYHQESGKYLLGEIQRAINGEYSAIQCYSQLANMAPTQEVRGQILEIREDERRHLDEFIRIYTNLTGRRPIPQITEECPEMYHVGLEAAFKDEQETVDFYMDIADKVQDMYIKETFRRAAGDEQNHAVWFLYFMNKK